MKILLLLRRYLSSDTKERFTVLKENPMVNTVVCDVYEIRFEGK